MKLPWKMLLSLRWKFNRLRAMGLPEIVWRFETLLHARLEQFGFGLANHVTTPSGSCGRLWKGAVPKRFDTDIYRLAAERILDGHYDIFSLRGVQLGFPPDWNRDPRTGTKAPMQPGKTLDYRSESLVGDIKYLWELNRHLELVTLAQAFSLTRNERFALGARALLESWFGQCPYPLGPNWTSSLEHAVRLVNWSYAWRLLGGEESVVFGADEGAKFRRNWLECIYRHLHFIQGHFSRYSSANNHLLGEYMGLFIGSVIWPLWPECGRWRDLAKAGFEREALKQNTPDGVNREQATWYHHEVADMMLHCGLAGRANGLEFSSTYWGRLAAMLEYVASVMDVAGHVPMFGDSDDAMMVRFSQETDFDVFRSLLATGAVLFGRGDFKVKAGRFDDKSRWLLGDSAEQAFAALSVDSARLPVRREFPEGGYWILGDHLETVHEVRMVADAGLLGYLSIAAHGHADALSFTLSLYGREILVDPGTYAYHTRKDWRDYFRGTSAHNTLRVDGEDQSVIGGNFLWLQHARVQCEKFTTGPDRDEWQASHDGYLRLTESVRHRRSIILDKHAAEIRVEDMLEGAGRHQIEIFWHFAEDCVVEHDQGVWLVRSDVAVLQFDMPGEFETRKVHGSQTPLLGWISRCFDEKQATTVLVCSGYANAGAAHKTVIRYGVFGPG